MINVYKPSMLFFSFLFSPNVPTLCQLQFWPQREINPADHAKGLELIEQMKPRMKEINNLVISFKIVELQQSGNFMPNTILTGNHSESY